MTENVNFILTLLTMPQKFYLDKILLHAQVHFAKSESVLHIIHMYYNFTPDQALKVYLCIIHECTL